MYKFVNKEILCLEHTESKINKVDLTDDCFIQKRIYCDQCHERNDEFVNYNKVIEFLQKEYLKSNLLDEQLISLKINIENLRKAINHQFDYMTRLIQQFGTEKRQIQINENLLKDLLTDPRNNYMNINNLLQDVSQKVIRNGEEISLKKQYYDEFELNILDQIETSCDKYLQTIVDVSNLTKITPPLIELIRVPEISLMKEFNVDQYLYQQQLKEPNLVEVQIYKLIGEPKAKIIESVLNPQKDIICVAVEANSERNLYFYKIVKQQREIPFKIIVKQNITGIVKQIKFTQDNSLYFLKNEILTFMEFKNQKWSHCVTLNNTLANCFAISEEQPIYAAIGGKQILLLHQPNLHQKEVWDELIVFNQSEITCLQFNSLSNLLLAGNKDGALIIYSIIDKIWQFKQIIYKHTAAINFLSFTTQTSFISSTYNSIIYWPNKVEDFYIVAYELEKRPNNVIAYDKKHLVVSYGNQTAIFQIEDQKLILNYNLSQSKKQELFKIAVEEGGNINIYSLQ